MEVQQFKRELLSTDDDLAFCRRNVFSDRVWLLEHRFSNPVLTYKEIKLYFSDALSIGIDNVAIVGSSRFGFSVSPRKPYRAFDSETSDIDLVIVATDLFRRLWNELFRLFYTRSVYIDGGHQKDVFRKFVNISRDSDVPSELIRDWHQNMDSLKRSFFTKFRIANGINYRIYEDWQAAELYHAYSLGQLRRRTLEIERDNTE